MLSVSVFGQDRPPQIAVIPFHPITVSKADADAITSIFETALVKTGAYQVIEQAQVHEILEYQEFSLSDCTSEECAIEVGQLLSAEQVVLGSLASIGGKFVLSAKIVDVARGINLKADQVDSRSLADMTDEAELLASRLAGVPYRKERPGAFVLTVEPGLSFPGQLIGTSIENAIWPYRSLEWPTPRIGVQVSGAFAMPFLPVLFVVVTGDFEYSPEIHADSAFWGVVQITGMRLAGEAGLGVRFRPAGRLDLRLQLTAGYFDEMLFDNYEIHVHRDDGYAALALGTYYRLGRSFSIGAGASAELDFHLQWLLCAHAGVSWDFGSTP